MNMQMKELVLRGILGGQGFVAYCLGEALNGMIESWEGSGPAGLQKAISWLEMAAEIDSRGRESSNIEEVKKALAKLVSEREHSREAEEEEEGDPHAD